MRSKVTEKKKERKEIENKKEMEKELEKKEMEKKKEEEKEKDMSLIRQQSKLLTVFKIFMLYVMY